MTGPAPNGVGDERAHLLQLINGYRISQAIYTVTVLGIPDLIAGAARSSEELAAATQSHPRSLYRVMRALAAVGIFEESEGRSFRLTPLGAGLRREAEGSRRAWVEFSLRPAHWSAWGQMLHGVRTGANPFRHVHGADVWSYRAGHPEESAAFDRAMRERTGCLARDLLPRYDFSAFAHMVDVGGGPGSLLAALLSVFPGARGTLLDLPHVVAGAPAVLGEAGVNGRCAIVGGSFFDEVPAGGDAYLLKHILHAWDDHPALRILGNCRRAMTGDAKLLVIERLLAPANEGAEGKLSDLNMLVNAGGRERSCEELTAMLAAAGFEITAKLPLSGGQHLIEAVPAKRR